MFAEGLVAFLAGDANVTALLGTSTSRQDQTNGIFPDIMPEGTPLPALVYSDIHAANEHTLDGPDPFTTSRIQISAHGKTKGQAKTLARTVRQDLEAFTGTFSDGTEVDSIERITELDAFADAPFSFVVHVDFNAFWRDVT